MHIAKYERSAVGHILAHNEPNKTRAQRLNVDGQLTCRNYNLVEGKGSDNLKKVLQNVYCSKRKDVNVLVSCVVSAPLNLPVEQTDEFFRCAFDFFNERYQCPVVSAWVHLDEPNARGHLHYQFCPVVWDDKKKRFKVRAKDVVNRADLQTLHTDFKSYVDKRLGLDLDVVTHTGTSKKNLSLLEFKKNELHKDVAKLKKLKADLIRQIERERTR